MEEVGLGTVEFSEQLIQDLYLGLRAKINRWASVTHQTAQARMGYVGQHLVSVVTGHPGGRSGARGKDLILGHGEWAEIKTCYRVDQLGACADCGAAVASIESECPACSSQNLIRRDDSKWLIGLRNDDEFEKVLDPKYYFLVLFEFTDLTKPDTIRATIWRVDSTAPGFSLCMIDYYMNIRSASISKAPFNLWPYSLKFYAMRPVSIYQALIGSDDKITTVRFPGREEEQLEVMPPMDEFSSSRNLTADKAHRIAERLGIHVSASGSKAAVLRELSLIAREGMDNAGVADAVAVSLYEDEVRQHWDDLPDKLKDKVGAYL